MTDQIRYVAHHTSAPCGVGFFAFDLPARPADLEAAAGAVRVIDVFWGPPQRAVVDRVHAGGALVLWQVGTRDDTRAAADAGCDAVVVQGVEAGGHVCATTPLLQLLDEVAGDVDVPLVAAGGIATAIDVRRAVDTGASAVRVGTRLLATAESAAHPRYLEALLAASAADTELTTAFSVGWENAPHRVLRTAIDAAEASEDPVGRAAFGDAGWPIVKWSVQPPSTFCDGDVSAMAMYAGNGVGAITDIRPAREVVQELMADLVAQES